MGRRLFSYSFQISMNHRQLLVEICHHNIEVPSHTAKLITVSDMYPLLQISLRNFFYVLFKTKHRSGDLMRHQQGDNNDKHAYNQSGNHIRYDNGRENRKRGLFDNQL